LARLPAEPSEIAGIEANAGETMAPCAQLAPGSDGVAHTLQRGIRIDEEDRVVRYGVGVSAKGLFLGVERHHPTVRVRAAHWDSKALPGERIRGGHAAANEGRAAGAQATIGPLRAPQPELDDRIALRGQADARGLGGDERLEVDDVEQRRLGELAL